MKNINRLWKIVKGNAKVTVDGLNELDAVTRDHRRVLFNHANILLEHKNCINNHADILKSHERRITSAGVGLIFAGLGGFATFMLVQYLDNERAKHEKRIKDLETQMKLNNAAIDVLLGPDNPEDKEEEKKEEE